MDSVVVIVKTIIEGNLIIDTKGYHTQQGDMRIKMLKWRFSTAGESPIIETPKNQTECRLLVDKLKK